MSSDALIQISDVKHTFHTNAGPLPVLDGWTLKSRRAFVAVVGPSGCGKSTLTRLIAGLLIPDEGDVILNGEKVRSPHSIVGMFQNLVLLEWRTILDNVCLPMEIVLNDLTRKQRDAATNLAMSVSKGLRTRNRPNYRAACASAPLKLRARPPAGSADPRRAVRR